MQIFQTQTSTYGFLLSGIPDATEPRRSRFYVLHFKYLWFFIHYLHWDTIWTSRWWMWHYMKNFGRIPDVEIPFTTSCDDKTSSEWTWNSFRKIDCKPKPPLRTQEKSCPTNRIHRHRTWTTERQGPWLVVFCIRLGVQCELSQWDTIGMRRGWMWHFVYNLGITWLKGDEEENKSHGVSWGFWTKWGSSGSWDFNVFFLVGLVSFHLNKKVEKPRVKSVTLNLWWVEKPIKLLDEYPSCVS